MRPMLARYEIHRGEYRIAEADRDSLEAAQQIRGRLSGAMFHSAEKWLADNGTSAPIELEPAQKEQLLRAVRVCMKHGR